MSNMYIIIRCYIFKKIKNQNEKRKVLKQWKKVFINKTFVFFFYLQKQPTELWGLLGEKY